MRVNDAQSIITIISVMVLYELSTFVTYCQTIFKNTVESGIIIGKNKHFMLAGSFNLLMLLPSNVVIVRTHVKTSS